MSISLKLAVSPKLASRAGKSLPSGDAAAANSKHPRRQLDSKTREAACFFKTGISEPNSPRAKSRIGGSSYGADRRDSGEVEVDELESRLPASSASQRSHPPSARREACKKLQLARYGAGPRKDPFSTYPIPARGCVPHAVDVFLQVWAPRQIPPHLRSTVGNPLASQLFPLALQNAGLFEAVVALAQTYEAAHYTNELQPSKEVLKHCGNALTKLRNQLSLPSTPVDDTLTLTVLFLMGVHYLVGDTASFEVHLKGIHRMVELRGGLDKLGLHGITKAMVLQIDNYWTLMTGVVSKFSSTKHIENLEYPTHPFFPDLCACIAVMPKGFRDLALEAMVSVQVLQILERMSRFVTHVDRMLQHVATAQEVYFLLLYKPHLVVQDAFLCLEAWRRGCGSKMEPALCYGLIAFSWLVTGQARIGPVYWRLVQKFMDWIEQIEPKEPEMECLIWLSMVAAVHCQGHDTFSERADLLLDRLLQMHAPAQDWANLQALLRKFFWHTPLVADWHQCWKAAIVRRARPTPPHQTLSPVTVSSDSIQESLEPGTPRNAPASPPSNHA